MNLKSPTEDPTENPTEREREKRICITHVTPSCSSSAAPHAFTRIAFFALFGKDRTCRGDRQPGSRKVIDLANHVLVCWLYFRSWYLLRMPMHSVAAFHLSFLQPLNPNTPAALLANLLRGHTVQQEQQQLHVQKPRHKQPGMYTRMLPAYSLYIEPPRANLITNRPFIQGHLPEPESSPLVQCVSWAQPFIYRLIAILLPISLSSRHLPTSTLGNRITSSTA